MTDFNNSQPLIDSTNSSDSNTLAATTEIPTPQPQQNTTDFDSNDIGKWPKSVNSNMRLLLIQRGPEVVQHMNTDFAEVSTVSRTIQSDTDSTKSKVVSRRLTNDWFYRTLSNGEKVLRSWMAYSPSKASLFCFCCRLLENANSSNASKFYSSGGFKTQLPNKHLNTYYYYLLLYAPGVKLIKSCLVNILTFLWVSYPISSHSVCSVRSGGSLS